MPCCLRLGSPISVRWVRPTHAGAHGAALGTSCDPTPRLFHACGSASSSTSKTAQITWDGCTTLVRHDRGITCVASMEPFFLSNPSTNSPVWVPRKGLPTFARLRHSSTLGWDRVDPTTPPQKKTKRRETGVSSFFSFSNFSLSFFPFSPGSGVPVEKGWISTFVGHVNRRHLECGSADAMVKFLKVRRRRNTKQRGRDGTPSKDGGMQKRSHETRERSIPTKSKNETCFLRTNEGWRGTSTKQKGQVRLTQRVFLRGCSQIRVCDRSNVRVWTWHDHPCLEIARTHSQGRSSCC